MANDRKIRREVPSTPSGRIDQSYCYPTHAQSQPEESIDGVSVSSGAAEAGVETTEGAAPLMLSFQGLGNFDDNVLFSRLVEDEEAKKLRSVVSALHGRFSDARLLGSSPPYDSRSVEGKWGNTCVGTRNDFDFKPHLTVMKTSKLKDRRTLIPPSCYDQHRDIVFGSHGPLAVELSSMLEKEKRPSPEGWEPLPYYKCVHKINLRSPVPYYWSVCGVNGGVITTPFVSVL